MRTRTSFVVVDNNIFGCVSGKNLDIQILASSIIRGASVTWRDGTIPIPTKGIRPATRADFEIFRVSSKGYAEDPHFDFPKS